MTPLIWSRSIATTQALPPTSATRLFLHIGRNKAGSTSLQDFCGERASWLAERGVSYVLVSHLADGSNGLPSLASNQDIVDFVRACPLPIVFASNEIFAALSPEQAATVSRELAVLDMHILCYVRPYREWVRSSYSYDVWIGANGRDFDIYLRDLQHRVSVWPALLSWADAVGWHRMHVRTTDARDLTGGDLLGDCLATMGVALPAGYRARRSNAAPHWMVTELLRLMMGAEKTPGRRESADMTAAEALRDLANEAIAETGHQQNSAAYTTQAQDEALRRLYEEDLARLHQATGTRLSADEPRQSIERAFLPSAEHVPAAVLSRIAELARRPAFARQHGELADFIHGPAFARLHARRNAVALALPAGSPHLAQAEDEMGAPMGDAVAEMVHEEASAAFRLAGQGNLIGAIEAGTRAARTHADTRLLGAMARWRHDAFLAKAHPPGLPNWPPHLPDPFPDVAGIPAVDAHDLTADILGGAILHHGSLHVRGLVSAAVAGTLQEGIDRALAAQLRADAHEPALDDGWFAPIDVPAMASARDWPHGPNAMYTADSPPMLQALVDALGRSGIVDRIAEFMGERPALSVAKSTLRRQAAVPISGWHQDGAFLGQQVRSVNVWLALSDCGTAAPSMDVIGRRLPYVVQTNSHGAIFDWSVGEGMVDILAEGGAPVQTPDFRAGDALLFDHLMLHRTSLKPGATGTRWAIESWFFAPTDYPYDRVPLYV